MEIERAGITFDVSYRGGSRGSWNEPPEGAEIEIGSWRVSDWDELAACHGAKGDTPIIRESLNEMVDVIMGREYDSMLDDAEQEVLDDFDPPDDEPDYGESDLWG